MSQPESGSSPTYPTDMAQLTVRAVLTGMLLGGVLSLCNIYVGLKIGWGMGMSITAALLGYGLWQLLKLTGRVQGLTILETNINQTTASAAASISSAGLVAPIPALTMLTGQTLSWGPLVIWTFSVCMVGIVVSIGLRKQLIEVDKLAFPSGTATAKTLLEIYSHGRQALARLRMLGGMALLAASIKITEFTAGLQRLSLPGRWSARPGGGLEAAGIGGYSSANLGFSVEPTTLMYGVGALAGPRVGISIMLGSLLAWATLLPMALEAGWVQPGADSPDTSWYGQGLKWLLWPGVALMVSSALTSFAFSWRTVVAAIMPQSRKTVEVDDPNRVLPRQWFMLLLVLVMAVSVALQVSFFGITAWIAALGVLLTFMLALVAARVSGETNVTPVGAMGKVTQLCFAVLAPGQPAANLMSANVTGGAASQCADMMHDLKTGHLIGAHPRPLFIAQFFGALAGALVGSAGYLVLVPDPVNQLMTEEWPAPSVAAWKAVAELFMQGLGALPPGATEGILYGTLAGIVLAVLEKTLPKKWRAWVPSGPSVGLAFVIPAYNAISLFLGSLMGAAVGRIVPGWSAKFLIICASGLIAGESLTGVGLAIIEVIRGALL